MMLLMLSDATAATVATAAAGADAANALLHAMLQMMLVKLLPLLLGPSFLPSPPPSTQAASPHTCLASGLHERGLFWIAAPVGKDGLVAPAEVAAHQYCRAHKGGRRGGTAAAAAAAAAAAVSNVKSWQQCSRGAAKQKH